METKNITRRGFFKQAAASAALVSTELLSAKPSLGAQTQVDDESTQVAGSELYETILNDEKVRLELKGENSLICFDWSARVDIECELVFDGKGNLQRCLNMVDGVIRSITAPKTFEELSIKRDTLEKLICEGYEESRARLNQEPARFIQVNVRLVSVKILDFRLTP